MSTEIETLLQKHAEQINVLREKIKDVLEDKKYDDIFLLRYILSFKTAEEAEEPARFTIKWRHEHKDEIERIKRGEKLPFADIISQFQVAGEHKSTSRGEPIMYVRIGLCNTTGLMDAVSYDDVLHYMTFVRVKTLEYCDAESRRQGRLIKGIGVLDFQGASFSRGNDSRFGKIIGESSKLNEKLFPQLLGHSIFINIPGWFSFMFSLLKPLMSKRAIEKMIFCPGNNSGKSITDCPFVSKYLKVDDVPTFLGGNCSCPGGCIGGVPNSQKEPITGITSDGMAKISIPARNIKSVELPVTCGTTIHYSIKSESKKISVEGWFQRDTVERVVEKDNVIVERTTFESEHEVIISGKFRAEKDGFAVFQFDNKHSLIWSKTVMYKVDYDLSHLGIEETKANNNL